MHGGGVYTWKDGRMYEGDYENDRKHGYGIYTWNDGKQYEGWWQNGKQHGEGIYRKDGRDRRGIWEDGKRIKWLDDPKWADLRDTHQPQGVIDQEGVPLN